MKTIMLGLLAETSIHPGAGRSTGVVDLPVAREAATDYPVLVGSSLKGALRDKTKPETTESNLNQQFGKPDHAGELIISDGRLLLLPVRSLTDSFYWITCPHIIERYKRDLLRSGLLPQPDILSVDRGVALTDGQGILFLEERQFSIEDKPGTELAEAIKPLVLHQETRDRLSSRIAVLNDDDFAWFVRYGLQVQARNVLDGETKKSKNLWYEETLPPDTIMYALIMSRNVESINFLKTLFPEDNPYLQTGGNETVGQGWFAVSMRDGSSGGEE